MTAEHNPAKPFCYCWFHGWNFSHAGNTCKRILKSNDQGRINSTSPTSTNPPGSSGGCEKTRRTAHHVLQPRSHTTSLPPLPQQRVLLDETIDLAFTPRVTWHDQLPLPAPQQRVEIEKLPDDTTILLPTTPTITVPSSQPTPVLPPPPWTSYDLASASGTAINFPDGPAFRNPNTADRAAYLAARINELEDELTRSRAYYSSTD